MIAAGITLQRARGKIPAADIKRVDAWVELASKRDKRALRVLNNRGASASKMEINALEMTQEA